MSTSEPHFLHSVFKNYIHTYIFAFGCVHLKSCIVFIFAVVHTDFSDYIRSLVHHAQNLATRYFGNTESKSGRGSLLLTEVIMEIGQVGRQIITSVNNGELLAFLDSIVPSTLCAKF